MKWNGNTLISGIPSTLCDLKIHIDPIFNTRVYLPTYLSLTLKEYLLTKIDAELCIEIWNSNIENNSVLFGTKDFLLGHISLRNDELFRLLEGNTAISSYYLCNKKNVDDIKPGEGIDTQIPVEEMMDPSLQLISPPIPTPSNQDNLIEEKLLTGVNHPTMARIEMLSPMNNDDTSLKKNNTSYGKFFAVIECSEILSVLQIISYKIFRMLMSLDFTLLYWVLVQ